MFYKEFLIKFVCIKEFLCCRFFNFAILFMKGMVINMQLADATRKRITKLLNQSNMKPYDLSRAAGIALPTLSDFMKGDTKNLRMDTMLHICEGLDTNFQEFFNDPIFLDIEDSSEDKLNK